MPAPKKPVEDTTEATTFTNLNNNTTVHVGDGRKVLPGETIEVSAELKKTLEAIKDPLTGQAAELAAQRQQRLDYSAQEKGRA